MNIDFQIGDKVIWHIGAVTGKGVFLEDNDDGTVTVIAHFINNVPSGMEQKVVKKFLKLDVC